MFLAFDLMPPVSINHMFGTWVLNMQGGMRKLLLVGIGAILWAIWLSQNDIAFDKLPVFSHMQVIYRDTHWARMWSLF
jgi:hypothetical protein